MPEVTPYYPRLFKKFIIRVGDPIDLADHPLLDSVRGLQVDEARAIITRFIEGEMGKVWGQVRKDWVEGGYEKGGLGRIVEKS